MDGESPRRDSVESESAASKPFRFKHDREHEAASVEDQSRRHRRRHHRHRRHKRRRVDDARSPPNETSSLHPDVAFRESLFDALGDDEGAEFWQGVYGQPIHNYPRTYEDADTGEIDMMDDEQYARYVRHKMWEKSAEGMEAAREAKRKERRREQEARREERSNQPIQEEPAYNNFTFDFELEASLRRGEERKERKRWQQLWQAYLDRWKELQDLYEARKGSSADDTEQVYLRNKIAWPVETGKRKDLTPDEIEKYITKVSTSVQESTKSSILKSERVRWHPDKIQQRYGFMNIEDGTMQGVTSVFQVLDRMWNDLRSHER